MEWQPIETAPRDGSDIILGGPDQVAVGSSPYSGEGWYITEYYEENATWPTHWMPLPTPPLER